MNKNHLYKGTLSALLLKLLDEHGRMYGYQLSKKAREVTSGDLDITEGSLYPALHKLEADGILITEVEKVGNRKRKYYRLAPEKQSEIRRRIEEFAEYARNLQSFLNPNPSHG
jgi:PadR family transcriptional regulator PadR